MKTPTLEQVFAAAKAHGEQTEPDHEIGDLQDLVWACFHTMSDEQGETVLAEMAEFVSEWGPK